MRFVNAVVAFLLRSPLHGLLSRGVALITVTGRRTGARYTTPVQYVERDGDLYVISRRERTWWRNLRGGAPAEVLVRRHHRAATGDIIPEASRPEAVALFAGTSLERAAQRPDTVVIRLHPNTP